MSISKTNGFTLIELSIVLVIIGLIVGGVLVGQDLVRAAEVRATLSQIEKFNTAVNTFLGKYGGLPGDLSYSQAARFNLFTVSDGSQGHIGEENGNGLIESYYGNGVDAWGTTSPPAPGNPWYVGGEQYIFWRHLSEAGLIGGSFGSGLDTSGNPSADTTEVTQYFPAAKINSNSVFVVGSDGAYNYFALGVVLNVYTGLAPWGTLGVPALRPLDARTIDAKIDDGLPYFGRVRTIGTEWGAMTPNAGLGHVMYNSPTPTASNCVVSPSGSIDDTASTYDTGPASGKTPNCDLLFQFQ